MPLWLVQRALVLRRNNKPQGNLVSNPIPRLPEPGFSIENPLERIQHLVELSHHLRRILRQILGSFPTTRRSR